MEELSNSVSADYEVSVLRSAPSFSIFNTDGDKFQDSYVQAPGRTISIGGSIEGRMGDFSFEDKTMGLIEEEGEEVENLDGIKTSRVEDDQVQPPSPPMYLATGLGFDDGAFGLQGGYDFPMPEVNENGGEEYYEKMVDEYPCHPFFLRNYAQILQSKGDLLGAEEYFFRATQANPEDGEVLVQYAKLVWELHHDQNKALSYFEHAARASPEDSHVLAAYASFLWEIEDDQEEEEEAVQDQIQAEKQETLNELDNMDTKEEIMEGSIAKGDEVEDVEEYYKMMIKENPKSALVLKKYADFLCQTKGDLQGAEESYLQATVADPGDGEILAQYAQLVWELHHDSTKALSYFERAVEATPKDSFVLGAYARFLWEAEEDDN